MPAVPLVGKRLAPSVQGVDDDHGVIKEHLVVVIVGAEFEARFAEAVNPEYLNNTGRNSPSPCKTARRRKRRRPARRA